MAKLYFYYSAMNAGKSTTLLQADFNYRERGMTTMLWTSAIDDRAGEGRIASRIGLAAAKQHSGAYATADQHQKRRQNHEQDKRLASHFLLGRSTLCFERVIHALFTDLVCLYVCHFTRALHVYPAKMTPLG